MIHGIQVFESLAMWLLLVLTPLAEMILAYFGITNPLYVRIIHGLAVAFFSWRIWTGLYGEKDPNKANAHRFHRPYWWMLFAGLGLMVVTFFNIFDVTGRLTGMMGGQMPFEPTSTTAASTTFKVGERLVAGVLTSVGVWLVKRSVYGKPREPRERRRERQEASGASQEPLRRTARGARKQLKAAKASTKGGSGVQWFSSGKP